MRSTAYIVTVEESQPLLRCKYLREVGWSLAVFLISFVISLVADMVIIRPRDAKRWKNDYLGKGVSLPPLAYNVLRIKNRFNVFYTLLALVAFFFLSVDY